MINTIYTLIQSILCLFVIIYRGCHHHRHHRQRLTSRESNPQGTTSFLPHRGSVGRFLAVKITVKTPSGYMTVLFISIDRMPFMASTFVINILNCIPGCPTKDICSQHLCNLLSILYFIFTDWLWWQGEYSFFLGGRSFLFFFCGKKFVIWGQNIFLRFVSKNKWDTQAFFFDILASFGVKNVCALFREIEWALSTFTITNRFGMKFSEIILLR